MDHENATGTRRAIDERARSVQVQNEHRRRWSRVRRWWRVTRKARREVERCVARVVSANETARCQRRAQKAARGDTVMNGRCR
eukprot:1733011-Pleurochrysis_carterae.AAC.1